MNRRLAHVALLVRDYDEAIDFYTRKLDFVLLEDTELSAGKRWVLLSPGDAKGCCLLLAKATNDQQRNYIGNQSGSRVFLFLHTDNFDRDYLRLQKEGIKIARDRSVEPYGTVAVFEDLYGNLWDLVEPSPGKHSIF